MRKWWVIVGFLIGLALVGSASLVSSTAAPTATPAPGLPSRADSSRIVVGRIELEPQTGQLYLIFDGDLATPTPSPTATPTRTPPPAPSVTPTSTPEPTATPEPTRTPVPTATSAIVPTQEHVETPFPTPEPGPGKVCELKSNTVLRVRRGPATTEQQVPPYSAQIGSVFVVSEFAEAGGYLWAHHADGWSAIRNQDTGEWWVDGITGTSDICQDIPGWPAGLTPPDALVRLGWWVGPGANVPELLRAGDILSAAGIQPAATTYAADDAARQLAASGWAVIYRPWFGDCPDMSLPADVSARVRVSEAERLSDGIAWSYLVLSNECIWPDTPYLRDWLTAAVDEAARRGMARGLVPVVWASGQPEMDVIPALREPLTALRDAGGYWGMNVYPVEPSRTLCAIDAYTAWTTWRWQMYADALPDGLRTVVTEAASGWGAGITSNGDYSCWWDQVRGDFEAVTLWYVAGPAGIEPWTGANLAGRLVWLASALVG